MSLKKLNVQELLQLSMRSNDVRARTVGEYLAHLLVRLWQEEAGFSGKRPFGNSGWRQDIQRALIHADVVDGLLDKDGYVEKVNEKQVANIIRQCCTALWFFPGKSESADEHAEAPQEQEEAG